MQKQMRWIALAVVLCAASADADEIAGRVFLPDGRPAVGAKIIARNIGPNFPRWTFLDDVETVTDDEGTFAATVTRVMLTAGSGRWNRPYLLIDAPGCAMCFMPLTDALKAESVNGIKGNDGAIVHLQRAFTFRGTVVGPNQKPVPGARVAASYWTMNDMEGAPLNWEGHIDTPQLATKSGADGKFALRGITGPAPDNPDAYGNFSSGNVSAVATIQGNLWTAATHARAKITSKGIQADALPTMVLQPTVTFGGHLLDAVTGKPLPDVEVEAVSTSRPPYGVPALRNVDHTGFDGSFKVTALSPARLIFTQFQKRPAGQWGYWRPEEVATGVSKTKEIVGPQRLENLTFRLPPLTVVCGRFVDEATGKTPLTREDISATLDPVTRDGWQFTGAWSYDYSDNEGRFSLVVPAGPLKIASGVRSDYAHAYSCAPQTRQAPPGGLADIVVKVQRNPGFLVRLRPREEKYPLPSGRYEVHWRRADGVQQIKEMHDESGGYYWFQPAKSWGETAQMRILRDKTEIVPWTQVVADSKQWPLIVYPN